MELGKWLKAVRVEPDLVSSTILFPSPSSGTEPGIAQSTARYDPKKHNGGGRSKKITGPGFNFWDSVREAPEHCAQNKFLIPQTNKNYK